MACCPWRNRIIFMPRRQQRTPALRRNFPLSSPQQYPSLDWEVDHIAGNKIFIRILQAPDWSQNVTDDFVLEGIPQFSFNPAAGFPDSAVWNKPLLEMEYLAGIVQPFDLYLPSNDPAFRNRLGAYLIGKKLNYDPPAPPVQSTFLSIAAPGPVIDITLDEPGGATYMHSRNAAAVALQFAVVETGELSLHADLLYGVVQVTFLVGPLSGQNVSCPGTIDWWLNTSGGNMNSASLLVP